MTTRRIPPLAVVAALVCGLALAAVGRKKTASAERFGVVAAALSGRGRPIGVYDTLLAAQALAMGLTVVANNTRHFSRVPGLSVENWA